MKISEVPSNCLRCNCLPCRKGSSERERSPKICGQFLLDRCPILSVLRGGTWLEIAATNPLSVGMPRSSAIKPSQPTAVHHVFFHHLHRYGAACSPADTPPEPAKGHTRRPNYPVREGYAKCTPIRPMPGR